MQKQSEQVETVDQPRSAWVYLGMYLPRIQGAVFVVSGLWPVVHLRSFMAVTGPKVDGWLVKTVGLLITVIGSVLGWRSVRTTTTPDLALLGGGSAAALAAIDVVYVARRRISPIYLLDAAMELGFVGGWLAWVLGRPAATPTTARIDDQAGAESTPNLSDPTSTRSSAMSVERVEQFQPQTVPDGHFRHALTLAVNALGSGTTIEELSFVLPGGRQTDLDRSVRSLQDLYNVCILHVAGLVVRGRLAGPEQRWLTFELRGHGEKLVLRVQADQTDTLNCFVAMLVRELNLMPAMALTSGE